MSRVNTSRFIAPIAFFGISVTFGLAFVSGCGDDETASTSSSTNATTSGSTTTTTGTGGSGGSTTSTGGAGSGGNGGMVNPGPPDVTANLRYINQQVFREDDAFAMGGIAQLEFYNPQALPTDDRDEFFNADNERCTYESGTEYPYSFKGNEWPQGPYQNAGNVTLTATGGPGSVVYEYFDTYYLRLSPGPVVQGSFTHGSFFPPEYIPHAAEVTLQAAGGPDVGAFTASDLQLAADYTVSSPNLVAGTAPIDADAVLNFAWGPPAPGDKMAVIVKDSFSFVKCVFDDDGQATVPAAAMMRLNGGGFNTFTVQTWREHTDKKRVVSADNKQVDIEFLSRHVQIGRFDTE